MSAESAAGSPRRVLSAAVAALTAVVLTVVFWLPLYRGGGFVGGDIYSYYLPQKDVFVESARAGELPLWHHRTGYGYPLIAESQTGVFYPFTWLCYLPLELNAAYNANHILHYVLAFWFTWLYARRLGLSTLPGLLAALVYVYGWFPARCSLEWAIIGGTWLPAALWTVESWLTSRQPRWLFATAILLTLQLTAGHFSIAFITLLTVSVYGLLRIWFRNPQSADGPSRTRASLWLVAPVAGAFCLAAVQIAPTWELKANSQRADVTEEHNPEYGHLPPMYLTQLVASWWYWYAPDVDTDRAIQGMTFLASNARTNKVEAHLYFGLIPLLLIVVSLFRGHWFRGHIEAVWAIIGCLFLVYTPGWLVPLTQHLPGFSFFEGPARYGVTTTLAAAILAASGLERLTASRRTAGPIVCLIVLVLTAAEFRVVARQVAVATMVDTPPISLRDQSVVRTALASRSDVRLFAPGPNLPNLCGVAAMPVYLGLSPAVYFNPNLMLPPADQFPSAAQLDWMATAGITHVLNLERVESDRLKLISDAPDPFLNAAWGRPRRLPVYLYELSGGRPRAFADTGAVRIAKLSSAEVVLDAELTSPGAVVLTDLMFPGWTMSADAVGTGIAPLRQSEPSRPAEMFRSVRLPAGQHRITWRYQPRGLYFGAAVSGVSWCLFIGLCVFARRRSRRDPATDPRQTARET